MEIIKELNLNKNPRAYKNNSAFFAKNIKLDETGTNIVRDDGISKVDIINNTLNVIKEKYKKPIHIVKLHGTIGEVLLFVSVNYEKIEIIRYNEEHDACVIYLTNIKTDSKEVSVDHFYDNSSSLHISFCGYDNTKNCSLKELDLLSYEDIINISKEIEDNIYKYEWEEDKENRFDVNHSIPFCLCKTEFITNNEIICGVYQFFIRYVYKTYNDLDYKSYTKWFPIGKELYALSLERNTIYDFGRMTINDFMTNNVLHKSNVSFNLELNFQKYNNSDIIEYQIGYVIKSESSVSGKLWKSFKFDNDTEIVKFDDNYLINNYDISVDDFTESIYNLYNVKNILYKNNRFYFSNYEEQNSIIAKSTECNYDITKNSQSSNFYSILSFDVIGYGLSDHYTFKGAHYDIPVSMPYGLLKVGDYVSTGFDKDGNSRASIKTLDFTILNYGIGRYIPSDQASGGPQGGVEQDMVYQRLFSLLYFYVTEIGPVYKGTFYIRPHGTDKFELDTTGNQYYVVTNATIVGQSYNLAELYFKRTIFANQSNSLDIFTPYEFYIHYVKRDGYYTDGVRLSKIYNETNYVYNRNEDKFLIISDRVDDNFDSGIDDAINDTVYGISFSNITVPNEYDGFFISYTKPERNILSAVIVTDPTDEDFDEVLNKNPNYTITDNNGYATVWLKASEITERLYSCNYKYLYAKGFTFLITNINYYVANSDVSFGKDDRIRCDMILYNAEENTKTDVINALTLDNVVYLSLFDNFSQDIKYDQTLYVNEDKQLIKLTDVIDKENTGYYANDNLCDFNYSSFVTIDSYVLYLTSIFFSEDGKLYTKVKLQNYPTEPLLYNNSVTKHSFFNLAASNLKFRPKTRIEVLQDNDFSAKFYYDASDWVDVLEMKSEYINKNNIKLYTNLKDNFDYIFNNTIRRSKVIGDEAKSIKFIDIDTSDYKNVIDNKGDVIKIANYNNNLFIHKEGDLYVLDADNKLSANNRTVSLASIDIFDLDPKRIIFSENGKCGISSKKHSVVCNLGYVFYSSFDKKIYLYGTKLSVLSTEIDYFLKNNNIVDCSFAVDDYNERLIICFTVLIGNSITYATISFSMKTGNFISLHDFKYKSSVSTETKTYFNYVIENPENEIYNGMANLSDSPYYISEILFDDRIFYKKNDENNPYRIIDVIFNADYENIKTLDSIRYSISKITNNFNFNEFQADNIDNEFPGNLIMIYSDSCATDYNDISGKSNNYKLSANNESYKYPWYERGLWNYNWFRNILNDNASNKKLTLHGQSDDKSLIYGKYIVARFVIKPEINFELETLNFNVK